MTDYAVNIWHPLDYLYSHIACFGSVLASPYVLSLPAPNYNDQSHYQTLSLHTSLFSRVKISSRMDFLRYISVLIYALRKKEKFVFCTYLENGVRWWGSSYHLHAWQPSSCIISEALLQTALGPWWFLLQKMRTGSSYYCAHIRRFRLDWAGYFAMCSTSDENSQWLGFARSMPITVRAI